METAKTLGDFAKDLPRPAVMCTIVRVTGSAPQAPGVRMWVTLGRFYGTLGGGEFERRTLARARELLLAQAPEPHLEEFVLCKEMGQCCGGRVEVFFEPVPRRKAVHLLGAGHVGRAAAHVLSRMPFELWLVDAREEWADPKAVPEDVSVRRAEPLDYARGRSWGGDDAVCIFTHSHELDLALVRFFLERPVGYLGLIGSEHKAQVFLSRLKDSPPPAAGDWESLWAEKMHCPIGLPLPSKDPKIIAVAISAELLKEWALEKPAPASGRLREGR